MAKTARRRSFAAPFVLTALLAPACGGKAAPTTTTPPEDKTSTKPAAPEGKGAWSQVGDGWTYAYDNGDQIQLGVDGGCRLMQKADCGGSADSPAEPIDCNPPPPQDVQCPPGLPDGATAK